MNLPLKRWLLLAGILAAGPIFAQDPAPEPRYAVEVIIFEHVDQSRSTPEAPVPPTPLLPGVTPPGQPMNQASRQPLSFLLLDPRLGAPDFLAMAPGDKSLESAYRRLNQLDAYRPVAHLAWTQRAWPRAAAEGLDLTESGLVPAGFRGKLTLYKERYLHLAMDLEMDQAGGQQAGETARIVESRRLRGDTTQYFDNPRFGAIAQVRELVPPEADAGDADSDSTG